MDKELCTNPAQYQYAWAGKIIRGCEDHMRQMVNVAEAIGSSMQVEKLSEPVQCEHKKEDI